VCLYAECRYAECRYAECRYAECRYAECRGAVKEQAGLLHLQEWQKYNYPLKTIHRLLSNSVDAHFKVYHFSG
jgi:hypothetical protein